MLIYSKVLDGLKHIEPGTPFTFKCFYHLGSRSSIQRVITQLIREEAIVRLVKGYYVKPKTLTSNSSIKVTASAEQLAIAWAKENDYKLTTQGMESAYRLGFQHQAPMRTIYWSNGPSRQFRVGNNMVEIRHVADSKLQWCGLPEGELFKAMLVRPPKGLNKQNLLQAFKRLDLLENNLSVIIKKLYDSSISRAWKKKLNYLFLN
jgi:hypothetical protein